ncbi:hypothetical protein FKM82_019987 [Ascaphus truei]
MDYPVIVAREWDNALVGFVGLFLITDFMLLFYFCDSCTSVPKTSLQVRQFGPYIQSSTPSLTERPCNAFAGPVWQRRG